jgi:hypothetical protein
MRVIFFFTMAALQDERKRMVGIYYGVDQEKVVSGRTSEYYKSMTALPWGAVAFHYCKDNSLLTPGVQFLGKALEKRLLCRSRFHVGKSAFGIPSWHRNIIEDATNNATTGTHIECIYTLMTFGIPREAIPIQDDGTLDLSNHHKMLQALQHREERDEPPRSRKVVELEPVKSPTTIPSEPALSKTAVEVEASQTPTTSENHVLVPGPMDVIMGRGRKPKSQPGALRMHHLVLEHRDAYEAAAKREKTVVAATILRDLKHLGCRFLMPAPDGFAVCGDDVARSKISHDFRNLRYKTKGNTQENDHKKRSLVETS